MPPVNRNNPYASASSSYAGNELKNSNDPREVEAQVLLKSARMMQDLQNHWDEVNAEILEETLTYNRQIWLMFYDTAMENPEGNRPNDLRSNIINLANFVFKRSVDVMAAPAKEKLDALIQINRDIAAGLMIKQQSETSNDKGPPEGPDGPTGGGLSTSA